MPYKKQSWKDEILAGPERYRIEQDGVISHPSASIELITDISQPASPVNAARFDYIENGIVQTYHDSYPDGQGQAAGPSGESGFPLAYVETGYTISMMLRRYLDFVYLVPMTFVRGSETYSGDLQYVATKSASISLGSMTTDMANLYAPRLDTSISIPAFSTIYDNTRGVYVPDVLIKDISIVFEIRRYSFNTQVYLIINNMATTQPQGLCFSPTMLVGYANTATKYRYTRNY